MVLNVKVSGSLETKYKIPAQGLTLTEKWNTANVLNTTVDLQDKLLPGLKLTLDTTYKPETNAFAGKVFLCVEKQANMVNK
jgi:voltage-dependent anion channel protein 2